MSVESMTKAADAEVTRDLRESVTRVWATARRLGLLRLDVPLRRRLIDVAPPKPKPRRRPRR